MRVMANNRLSIRRKPDIKLESVAAISKRLVERCECIFRKGLSGTRSTMTE
jgi:hypothetical protein